MSTLVVYAEDMGTNEHGVRLIATDATYLTAARQDAADGLASVLHVGQGDDVSEFFIQQSFIEFDTSELTGATVSAATLAMRGHTDYSSTNFYIDVFPYDFGDSVTTADWRDSDTGLPALTRVMYFDSSGFSTAASYANEFTSEAGAPGSVNKTGMTRYVLASREHVNESQPPAFEYEFVQFDNGATYPPRLTITYTSGGATANAGSAAATGASYTGSILVTPNSGTSAAVGTAYAATVDTAVLQVLYPDADITTTGWAEAPLWSKIDEADGTTITGTAS